MSELIVRAQNVKSENSRTGERWFETREDRYPGAMPVTSYYEGDGPHRVVQVKELDDGGLTVGYFSGTSSDQEWVVIGRYMRGGWVSWRVEPD